MGTTLRPSRKEREQDDPLATTQVASKGFIEMTFNVTLQQPLIIMGQHPILHSLKPTSFFPTKEKSLLPKGQITLLSKGNMATRSTLLSIPQSYLTLHVRKKPLLLETIAPRNYLHSFEASFFSPCWGRRRYSLNSF